MEGSTCFTSINVASELLQLEVYEDDWHVTGDAYGKLWKYIRRGIGMKTVPSAFANDVGGTLIELKNSGKEHPLGDMVASSRSTATHWVLLRVTRQSQCLHREELTLNLQKTKLCQTSMELVGMVVDRFET